MTDTGGYDHETVDAGGELLQFPTSVRQAGGELAEVDASDVEHVGPVYDAEIVDDPPPTTRVARVVQTGATVVATVRQSKRTVATAKFAVRQGTYMIAGTRILATRLWDAKTNARPERLMRVAEASGDWDHLGEWHDRGEKMRDSRHKRHMDFLELPLRAAKAFGISVLALHVLLLFLGFALWINGSVANMLVPMLGMYAGIAWTAHAVSVAWSIGWRVGLVVLVCGVWCVGKKNAIPGRWMAAETGVGDMMTSVLTEDTITAALCDTVSDFGRAVKAGWKVRYKIPPRYFEGGTHFQIDLPPKAPVVEFVKKRDLLAHNLKRYPIEVWPTEPEAGVLDGWIADPGVLTKPVGPWPVLKSLDNATCDYFKGIPVAMTLRGKVVTSPLSQKNYFMAGVMGSGKSSMAVTLVLGAILDPLVDVDVVVMAENGDYEPMRPALRSLHTGAETATVEAAIQLLRDRFRDLSEMGELLREQMAIDEAAGREPEKFVCREYAEREPRLRPRVMVFDECQNLFMSDHGKDAETIVKQLITTARKYATTLIFLTPDPTGDAVPSGVVRVMSNRACFPIGDQIGNDAAIGTGFHKRGITAANLVPAIDDELNDAGTCAARGFTNPPGMLRCFYVPQSDARRVTKRALQLRSGHQRVIEAARPIAEKRDLLADVGEVIGSQTIPAADIPALLSKAFPNQVLYRQMTGKQLRKLLLDDYGVRVPSTGNRWPVTPKLIGEALTEHRQLSEVDE